MLHFAVGVICPPELLILALMCRVLQCVSYPFPLTSTYLYPSEFVHTRQKAKPFFVKGWPLAFLSLWVSLKEANKQANSSDRARFVRRRVAKVVWLLSMSLNSETAFCIDCSVHNGAWARSPGHIKCLISSKSFWYRMGFIKTSGHTVTIVDPFANSSSWFTWFSCAHI
jgi:hypothetical protein